LKLNDIAYRYRDIVNQALLDVLNQPGYKNTGAGAASLTVDVIEGNATNSPQIKINFADHLIFLDKRSLQWTKQPDVSKLLRDIDVKKFSFIPGYKDGSTLPESKQKERIAWAIAKDKKNKDTWTGKPWRKKSLSKVLKEMNVMVLQAFDQAIQEDFDHAVKV
jgi:hypothetical protein